jgi:CYTH domain-containing protein
MSIVRRFLIAPSLARLVRKERGATRIVEGYFPAQSGRSSHVLVDGSQCHLVLATSGPEGLPVEERTEVPRGHAEALLDVCAGKAVFDRARIALPGGREAQVDRFSAPGPFDLVSVEFDGHEEADRFYAPAWFGPEVTGQGAYDRRAMALEGLPPAGEASLSNGALDALLDVLEDRFGAQRYAPAPAAPRREDDARVMEALRRLAGSGSGAATGTASAPTPATPATPGQPVTGRGPAPGGGPTAQRANVATAPAAAPAAAAAMALPEDEDDDERLDDVMQGLSRALGSPLDDEPEEQGSVVEVESWTRARRSEA